jgi:hypothetical protein
MQKPTLRVKQNEEIREYMPNKRMSRSLEIDLSEVEICDLSDREFKIMAIKVFTEVRRTM